MGDTRPRVTNAAKLTILSFKLRFCCLASFNTTVNDLFVFFTDNSTEGDGIIMNWDWCFNYDEGNEECIGEISSAQHPTYSFEVDGQYPVALTVTDQYGSQDTTISTVEVSVE